MLNSMRGDDINIHKRSFVLLAVHNGLCQGIHKAMPSCAIWANDAYPEMGNLTLVRDEMNA